MRRFAALGLMATTVITTACASIMHGSNQPVAFESTPTQARLTVDGVGRGTTPQIVTLSRKDQHTVKIELEGYQPYETVLTRSVSGWVWGNVVFGGLIGLAVDASTGGMYKLTPAQVQGALTQATQAGQARPGAGEQAAGETRNGGLFLRVVLRADPSWQQIGQLTRE